MSHSPLANPYKPETRRWLGSCRKTHGRGSTDPRSRTTIACMRGNDRQPRAMFNYVSAEERVPEDHPLRAIRTFVDDILREMTLEFDALYAQHGRPSIPPERLLRAQLLQLFY